MTDETYAEILDGQLIGKAPGKTTATTTVLGQTYTIPITVLDSSVIDISDATISLPQSDYSYKGKAVTPDVTVKTADGQTLTADDYTVSYKDNTSPGTATVTVEGKGNYTGSVSETFTITCKHDYVVSSTKKASTSANGYIQKTCSICKENGGKTVIYALKTMTLSTSTYTYDGKVKKPTVTIKDSKGNKISASNYKVSYASGRKNVGKYTVKVTFSGNYTGSLSKTFTIQPKSTTISKLTAATKGFTAKWSKQATQTTGYQIQYSTSSTFKNATTVKVTKTSTLSKKVSSLKAKTKYYVRIRTYKTVKVNGKSTTITSSWSKAKTVTTK